MSGLKKSSSLNWLFIELNSGSRSVVNVKSVVSPSKEQLRPGDVIKLNWRGDVKTATLIAYARDRDTLDAMVSPVKAEAESSKASCSKTYEEAEDYSCSETSWVPSDDEEMPSADSETGDIPVMPKMREQRCKTPTANRNHSKRRHTSLTKIMSIANHLPDSTQWQNGEELLDEEEVLCMMDELKGAFTNIFNIIDDLKRQSAINRKSKEDEKYLLKAELSETSNELSDYEDEEDNSDELNRSEDNVLITNKCNFNKRNERVEDEWIPIGSGKTLVRKDKYKRVNWKSFTIATRTLLLALFSRRVLATHSLTGKGSVMCLDPKIISDIIIEIMDRFDVREYLVRSVITTKCADECKMWKMRINKSKPKNDGYMSPDTTYISDKENHEERIYIYS